MPTLSVTRMKLASLRHVPRFLLSLRPLVFGVRESHGFLGGRVVVDTTLSLWTLTLWHNEDQVRAYYKRGVHRGVMPAMPVWACEAAKTRLSVGNPVFPTLLQAREWLMQPEAIFYNPLPKATQNHRDRVISHPGTPIINLTVRPRLNAAGPMSPWPPQK